MIAIVTKKKEASVAAVIKWLNHWHLECIRIDTHEILPKDITITLSSQKEEGYINIRGNNISLSSVKTVWFWHGVFSFPLLPKENFIQFPSNLIKEIFTHTNIELNALSRALSLLLENKNNLGKHRTYQINKIEFLIKSNSIGLLIPETIITTRKEELINFYLKHTCIISKGIQEIFYFSERNKNYINYSNIVKRSLINKLQETFFPSLFQQYIKKRIEIRTFFINGKFYSSAIFSQEDEQTKVDFRKYNFKNPNRIVPFRLPIDIEEKLVSLFKHFDLNTASVDLILDKSNKFYILDLNPVGQYGFISKACNYNLNRVIANHLKDLNER